MTIKVEECQQHQQEMQSSPALDDVPVVPMTNEQQQHSAQLPPQQHPMPESNEQQPMLTADQLVSLLSLLLPMTSCSCKKNIRRRKSKKKTRKPMKIFNIILKQIIIHK